MIALPDKVQRFADWSGAKLRPQKKAELEIDLPNFVEESDRPLETEPTETLVESKFQRNDAPWKNPKITLATAVGVAAAVSAIGFFAINSNFQWPSIGGPTLGSANNDDTEPVDHPDGKFQRSALTGPLGEGLDKDGSAKNPFLTSSNPAQATPGKGAKTNVSLNAPSTSKATRPVIASTPPVITASRIPSRPAYTDYGDGGASTPTRTVYPRTVANYVPSSPTRQSSTSSAPSTSAPVQQKSAEERRAEAIAATTFNGGSSSGSAQMVSSTSGSEVQGAQTKGDVYLAAENAVLDGTPQQLINRAKKAEGVLLQGLAFTPGDLKYLEDQEVTAEISNPLDSGLPVGTQIICSVKFPEGGQSQAKNAVVRLIPTGIVLGGNEYEIPQGSAILTAKGGKPFIAKRGGSEFFRFLGSATKTALSAGVGTLTSLVGGGSNILSSLTGLGSGRGSTTNQATEVLILEDNLPIQFSIIRPFSLPMASAETLVPIAQATQTTQFAQEPRDEKPMKFSPEPSDAELMAIVSQSRETFVTQETPNAQ
jgi:hypothetical protein